MLAISHLVGDYLLQTEWQARNKAGGLGSDPLARRALLAHVGTYTLAFVPALIWLADVEGGGVAVLAALAIAIPHLVIDDRRLDRALRSDGQGMHRSATVIGDRAARPEPAPDLPLDRRRAGRLSRRERNEYSAPMAPSTVELQIADGAATITLNRPDSLNSWNEEFGHDLRDGARAGGPRRRRAGGDDHRRRARLLLRRRPQRAALRRDGEAPDLSPRLRELYNPIILSVRELPKPVIAAVNGPAAGIGCSLALACDLIVAAESSFFLLAFVNVGLVPDGGTTLTVPARVGAARAAEMAMLGERVPAPTALEWGLINRVVPDAELDRPARRCSPSSPPARPAPTRTSSGCSTAASTPASPTSSTPRPRPSASRASPPTSSRA